MRHKPPLEPVDGVADLIAVHHPGERVKDPLQRYLQLFHIFNDLPILKNHDQYPVLREISDEVHVFLKIIDIAQRNTYRDATQIQRLDDSGELGSRQYLLVLEWTFQIDAKPDTIVVNICVEYLLTKNRPKNRSGQEKYSQ